LPNFPLHVVQPLGGAQPAVQPLLQPLQPLVQLLLLHALLWPKVTLWG
jgi:hypothetical protein